MKIATLLPAIGFLALTACATTPTPPASFDPAATSFTGWVRFTDGEFQLFEREVQVRNEFSRPCVSGALPLDLQRTARRDLSGQMVTFTGRAVSWADRSTPTGLTHEASIIRNTCGGDYVILAESVSVIR
ncbi:hypothetical protein [Brevundimonas lenta]|uniref:Lipoprotein n=1 Tax=Brevundimonas lenta TaxID=424796 RepID=A0A7W6JDE8_9CAUL|nr:hypothetical protein [Brevundimonas lenta]MBB4083079.1 hypothetical protein [Brevundimonas lenta]